MKNTKTSKEHKIAKEHIILAIIFALVLAMRLFMVFSEKGLDYEAYNVLRQVEHIKETGTPLFKDALSYSGRTFVFPPLFYYLLAGFSFFMPLELVIKIIPNLAFASLVIAVYLIAKHLTKNKTASLIAAFFSGFVPIIFYSINQASVYSLSLPLIFFLSYTFLRIEEKGFATMSIVLIILLLLTHSSVFILLISFIIYFIILTLEKQDINKKELEIALFLFFLTVWFNLLLYKKAFLLHGIKFIWQNIPAPLLSSYFEDITFLGVISAIGVLPLLLGVYAIYHVFFKTKNQAATLYLGFAFISFIMLWFKFIPFKVGLLFLSINLIILSAYGIKTILVTISKTKTPWLSNVIALSLVVLFTLTSIVPFVLSTKTDATPNPSDDDINALQWIRNNTAERVVVLGRVEEGFLINYASERRNVADQNFLLINNIDQRYEDIGLLFTLRLKSEAVRLMNDYKINYILLSNQTMKEYSITGLFYADPDCFDVVYRKEAIVYRFLRCDVE